MHSFLFFCLSFLDQNCNLHTKNHIHTHNLLYTYHAKGQTEFLTNSKQKRPYTKKISHWPPSIFGSLLSKYFFLIRVKINSLAFLLNIKIAHSKWWFVDKRFTVAPPRFYEHYWASQGIFVCSVLTENLFTKKNSFI